MLKKFFQGVAYGSGLTVAKRSIDWLADKGLEAANPNFTQGRDEKKLWNCSGEEQQNSQSSVKPKP